MTTSAEAVIAVLDLLDDIGAVPIVAGGWGVDALAGRQTRPHQDLDVAIRGECLDEAIRVLEHQGFAPTDDWLPVRIALRHPDGREVDLHPLTFRDDGTGIQQGLDTTTYEYPPDDIVSGQIGNRTVRCISVGLQIEFHSGYPHREVDRADVAVLKALNERTAR